MIKGYLFFMTPMCPDCQEIKQWLGSGEVRLTGEILDANEDEGREKAREYGVMSVPTMVFIDGDGKEQARARHMDEIKKVLDNRSLLDLA